ncbi:MAG: adenine phosphoribosyltransferase [Pleopsidium flavum]|nr:MAG: adenine phosphoribosyltransferase [Pleopsidium flavum]
MKQSTSSHPSPNTPDATTHSAQTPKLTPTASTSATELSGLKIRLHDALRQFPDFPSPGILFEDILPIFADPNLHEALIRALDLHVSSSYAAGEKPDVVVGLEARGLLFGPSLALRLGAGFVPVRKHGKLPGPTETARFEKEYGEDFFQIQKDSIKQGQRVIIVDDIIATGGSAAAAGSLVERLGGTLLGYIFILELDFLKGREKLQAPVYTLLSSQEQSSSKPT